MSTRNGTSWSGRCRVVLSQEVITRWERMLVLTGRRRSTTCSSLTPRARSLWLLATVAAFVGGGGLGRLLISGQRTNDYPQMFAGAFLIALLAIVLDLLLGAIAWLAARRARPRTDDTQLRVRFYIT